MLSDIRVVEMATYVAAPSAGGLLADWGADVIKIEPLSGCPMRNFYASALTDNYPDNPVFDLNNRGKKAIAINTSSERGRALVRQLAKQADIFITNVRPSQLEEQKLDYEALKSINPKLVYSSVTGFGLEGPEKDKAGFDSVAFWAKSGLAWIMTPMDTPPNPIRIAVGDHVTGLATVSGILAALHQAQRTGQGSLVESSLIRSAAYVMGSDFGTYLRYQRVARTRPRHETIVPMTNFFATKDDNWLFINARPGEPDWPNLIRALELTALAEDDRFKTARDRRQNSDALIDILDAQFRTRDYAAWKPRLDAEDIIYAPVQNFDQVIDDPQMHAAGVFVDQPKSDGTSYRAPASPIRFHGHHDGPRGPGPKIGEQSEAILTDLGLTQSDIETLIDDGIIGTQQR
jgi:crotonobetainyl-CoA:carnitine CoA-transferase CaiB-like acyl-CoA transferase